ncbi:uncharacterized protein LOC129218148 [Uloborus diversus]|uniref:uncharacterized protein LOC129218148 n=1 Tax=Uloborus diversus TaxID=327109 RepID=UPI00240940FF|nr:uncharacterized protein LOC129218148 [Uloborus diversus]XP_054708340.1 uncharacterized protein LOC129218148 [Uloborus diversus]
MKNSRSSCLVGIRLVPDGFSALNSPLSSGTIIGCLSLQPVAATISCKDFRTMLLAKFTNLPKEFIFLSCKGWPISKIEEENVIVSQLINADIITIERALGMPRIGIKWSNGESLGFIFINYSSLLTETREKIASELYEKIKENDFEFLDTNAWPIPNFQEKKLTVWDVISCNSLNIMPITKKRKVENVMHRPKKRPNKLNISSDSTTELNSSKNTKSILISYVHAEASAHARDLKSELINMGLESVFLDVDDIPPGKDWQDVINSSLNNCAAFVPLVTPRYGATKWTNREAKLADDKDKLIIPVSFLQKWPPDQLAIQFVTLQYIPWKTGDDFSSAEDHHLNDITLWEPRCVHRVAKEIKTLVSSDQDMSTPDSSSILDPQVNVNWLHSKMPPPERKRDFIVISAHCQQKGFVQNIMDHLELAAYKVWSSIEMCEYDGESFSSFDDSQQSEASPFNGLCADSCSRLNSPFNDSAPNSQSDAIFNFKHENNGVTNSKKLCSASSLQEQKRNFKMKVKHAKLVILIISEDYFKSRVCMQQAYYCGLRSKVIVVKLGEFPMENLVCNMFIEQDMIKANEENNLMDTIEQEISKKLQENSSKNCSDYLPYEVDKIKKEINSNFCVYITGGTSVSIKTETFCMILGSELAKIKNLTLVTEGSFGACDLVAKNFCEELDIKAKGKAHSIYHIIPRYDQVVTNRARQLDDGKFEKLPYGKTIYCGNSLVERDDIVSTMFKICILIEGDDQSACLAEKFLWNDRIVIPVVCKNMTAISSRQCLSESISKVPCWLVASDWDNLNSDDCTPEERATSVQKIIINLLKQQLKAKAPLQKKIK